MTRPFRYIVAIFLIFLAVPCLSQNKIPFGDIKTDDLRNLPYKPDPGADAIVLSDIGIAALNYANDEFYVELVRDVKIRIVNSKGFQHANIELAFSTGDDLMNYKASTFNLKNGEKIETPVGKKGFYKDFSDFSNTIRFTFPDVHEGSVVEYSYTVRLRNSSLYRLVPWKFQKGIPVASSSITVLYPEYFAYKTILNGLAARVNSSASTKNAYYAGKNVNVHVLTWFTSDMPAFVPEPYLKSHDESLTGITFELAKVDLPGFSEEITPSYQTLNSKLLERDDFGKTLQKSAFLKKIAGEITAGESSELEKLRLIHKYITENFTWNGEEDYSASVSLAKTFREKRGNSADINMLLIATLRQAGLQVQPVILSTRSNGSINQFSAILQQFNYVIARVKVGDNYYLVDATDPLRPYNLLPDECLNGSGRVVDNYFQEFVDLKNSERQETATTADFSMDLYGGISGKVETTYSSLSAAGLSKNVWLEGEEGYSDEIASKNSDIDITELKLTNLDVHDSDIVRTMQFSKDKACQIAGDKYLFNPFLSFISRSNPFSQDKRLFPVSFGSPMKEQVVINLLIPEGYTIVEKPGDISATLGQSDGKFEFSCMVKNNSLQVKCSIIINKAEFPPAQYKQIQDFYSAIIKKQSELVVIRKNS